MHELASSGEPRHVLIKLEGVIIVGWLRHVVEKVVILLHNSIYGVLIRQHSNVIDDAQINVETLLERLFSDVDEKLISVLAKQLHFQV